MEQVRLLSTTAIVTVLIWASADSLVNEAVSINVTFELVPAAGAGNMLLTQTAPQEAFDLQISGPRRVVEAIQEQAPLQVRLRVPHHATTGQNRIKLDRTWLKQELSEQFNEFRKLTIVSVQPDTLPVFVDHWITKEVDLLVGRLAMAYDVEPQLQRTTTIVRIRQSRFDELPAGQPLQIDISTDVERILREQPAGKSVTVPVTIDSSVFGPDAELNPGAVQVTATTKAQRRTARIPTVPILVAVSFANLEKPYAAVSRDGEPLTLVTRAITVTGPTEEVDRLERGLTRAYGTIHLKQADLEQLNDLKLVIPEYHLPPGIELVDKPEPIELRLIDKSAAASRR